MSFDIAWLHAGHEHNQTVTRFIEDRVWPGSGRKLAGPALCMAVTGSGRLLAGVALHNWDEDAGVIEMSAAADDKRWMSRRVLSALFGMIFDNIGCQTAVARVDARNLRLARIFSAFGFTETRLPNLRGRDRDELVFTLTADDWRKGKFHG